MQLMPIQELSDRQYPDRRNWLSFLSLMLMQVQNSFNDKAVQFLLVALGVALSKLSGSSEVSITGSMEYVLAGLIVTPFIAFAPIAGWVGDRFSKSSVIRCSSWLQFAVLLLLFIAVNIESIGLAIFSFFLLAVQSTFLSPAKMGIIKELVGTKKLAFASGLVEMGTILAILSGSILVNFWYDSRILQGMDPWQAVSLPIFLVLCVSPISVMASYGIERTLAASDEKFRAGICVNHFRQLAVVFQNRVLKLSAFGVAFFWTFGGFIQLVSVQIAKELHVNGVSGEGASLAWMMLVAGGGIALGSLFASLVSKRGIELGLVPVGGFVMVVGTASMGLCIPESGWFYASMLAAGAGAAMFLVPLNATLQDASDPSERGSVLAGSNLLNCCGGLAAVGLQLLLKQLGVPVSWQLFLFGALSLVATMIAIRILPQQAVRFVILAVFRIVYRIKIEKVENLPAEGGVLMVANHVSYIDSFVLSAASPRPIRFLMDEKFMKRGGLITLFTKLFNTVPISPVRAKEAIQVAAEALEEGAVVCIFPEGQLTRSGAMNEMKKGFQMIARRAAAPVIPVYMDGIWGSISSFERRQYFGKKPYTLQYGIAVAFGEAVSAKLATAEWVRSELNTLSELAFLQREIVRRPRSVFSKSLNILEGDGSVVELCLKRIRQKDLSEKRALVVNALQLGEGYSFHRGMTVIIDPSGAPDELDLIITLALLQKHQIIICSKDVHDLQSLLKNYDVDVAVGSSELCSLLADVKTGCVCYQFGWDASSVDFGKDAYLIGFQDGRAITRSSPHPDSDNPHQQFQAGWKEGSIGRLLPGYSVSESVKGTLKVRCGLEQEACLIEGRIDAEGFVFLTKELRD